jgi:thiamine-phosphate pyrophosphorylase
MTVAEAGADYIAFGAPAHLKDRDKGRDRRNDLVAWWAEIFQVPCVAFDVETAQEAEALARSGADFVAVTLNAGLAAGDARNRVAEFFAALRSVASEQVCA